MLIIAIMASCAILVGISYLMLNVLSGMVVTPRTPVREIAAEGELVIPLTERRVVSMHISNDGRFLAYVDRSAQSGEATLSVVELERGPAAIYSRPLKGERLAWLGMGHSLVYEDGGDIYRLDADLLAETNLTADPEQDREPMPSPDGRYILWTRSATGSAAGQAELWIMNADGSAKAFLAPRADLVTWDAVGEKLISRRQATEMPEEEGPRQFLQTTVPGLGRWEFYTDCEGEALYIWWPRQDELFFISPRKVSGQETIRGMWVLASDPTDLKNVASSNGLGTDTSYYHFYPSRVGARLACVGEKGLEWLDYDEKITYRYPSLEVEGPLAWREEAEEIYYPGPEGIYKVNARRE